MKKVKVKINGVFTFGETTSIVPHSDGKFPVWFEGNKIPEFCKSCNVEFLK